MLDAIRYALRRLAAHIDLAWTQAHLDAAHREIADREAELTSIPAQIRSAQQRCVKLERRVDRLVSEIDDTGRSPL